MLGPGLIWGLDFAGSGKAPVPVRQCDSTPAGEFRWLHLNLADHGTRLWIETRSGLPAELRELLLSSDNHQRAVVEDGCVGCVLHDFERDFDIADTGRIGALRLALTPDLMLTTRQHPLRSPDIAWRRMERGASADTPGPALDLLVGAITGYIAEISRALGNEVQHTEDAFLEDRHPPQQRDLIRIRRRLAQLHRMLHGMRGVFQRLEHDDELPATLLPTVEKLTQRLQSFDADILGVQAQLRQLREDVDIQATQRTNQNLYILSIVTALLLPATLVTGLFGMNTGGMPFSQSPHGTLAATLLAGAVAGATYWLLRWLGFIQR